MPPRCNYNDAVFPLLSFIKWMKKECYQVCAVHKKQKHDWFNSQTVLGVLITALMFINTEMDVFTPDRLMNSALWCHPEEAQNSIHSLLSLMINPSFRF